MFKSKSIRIAVVVMITMFVLSAVAQLVFDIPAIVVLRAIVAVIVTTLLVLFAVVWIQNGE